MDDRVFIIFVTLHNCFGSESYQVHANGYLLKPLSYPSLKNTMDQLLTPLFINEKYRVTKAGYRVIKLPVHDILYISYYNHTLTFHMFFGNTEKICGSFKNFFEQQRLDFLYQIHKSYVINMLWIERIEGQAVYLKNAGQPFFVSRKRKKDFLHAYIQFTEKTSNGCHFSAAACYNKVMFLQTRRL